MNADDYGATQERLRQATERFLEDIVDLDLDGMLAMIARADAVGWVIDPTLYRDGIEALHLVEGIVQSTRRYREELVKFNAAIVEDRARRLARR